MGIPCIKFLNCYNNQSTGKPMMMILTRARVKEWQGMYPPAVINSWRGSKLLIDDEIPDYTKIGNNLCDYWNNDNVEVKDGPFTCKCGSYNTSSTPRYKLDIKVVHHHGSGRFVFWDRQCADIIGILASELRNQMVAEGEDDPKAFPLTLDMLLARTMALRIKVQPSYNQSSVIRLSENPTLINSIAGQFGLLELHTGSTSKELKGKCHVNDIFQHEFSVSITADHDPDNLQVLTPAKRMLADLDLDLPDYIKPLSCHLLR
ncbi:hypothetical protein Lal_00008520 [Lupinus albus]|nr:hypothetical protein Lal_00008520 [Lupinus albus]